MKTTTKIFGTDDISRAVQVIGIDRVMDGIIARMEKAFTSYDPEKIDVPARSGFHYDIPQIGLIEWMPVITYGQHALMKLVCYHPNNPRDAGLPTILSTLSLIDTATGHVVAISDGTFLTAVRTGAASAIATRALASTESYGTVGIIGCGAQAVTQLHAISRVYPVDLVLYWDIDETARSSFPSRVSTIVSNSVRLKETPLNMIVPNVDVLCTATSNPAGAGPVFEDCPVSSSLHINAVGSDFPGKVEIPKALLQRATVVSDFAAQAAIEGECQQLPRDLHGPELHEVLRGENGNAVREQVTVFDSTGWALEDLVAMQALLEWGQDLDLGRDVPLESTPRDPRNPYLFNQTLHERMRFKKWQGRP